MVSIVAWTSIYSVDTQNTIHTTARQVGRAHDAQMIVCMKLGGPLT